MLPFELRLGTGKIHNSVIESRNRRKRTEGRQKKTGNIRRQGDS